METEKKFPEWKKKSFSLFSIMTFIQVGTGDGEDEKLLQLCTIFPRDDSQ